MARGGGEGKEGHPLRCLDAARYAAASMVTVLILIVVVTATKVVLFPESLYVSVVYGSVLVTRGDQQPYAAPPWDGGLVCKLSLRIDNPRRHARMYYVNVTAYLFDNDTPASSSDPARDSIDYFRQPDMAVRSQAEVNCTLGMDFTRKDMTPYFFDLLYNNESASMSGVTMRMDAMLLITDSSGGYNTSRFVTYYCWPLVVVQYHNLADVQDADDVFCRDVRGSHFI